MPCIEINFSDTWQFSSNNSCLYFRLLCSRKRETLFNPHWYKIFSCMKDIRLSSWCERKRCNGMDENAVVSWWQKYFILVVALCHQALTQFNPKIKPLLDGAESNKNRWGELERERQARQKENDDVKQHLITWQFLGLTRLLSILQCQKLVDHAHAQKLHLN